MGNGASKPTRALIDMTPIHVHYIMVKTLCHHFLQKECNKISLPVRTGNFRDALRLFQGVRVRHIVPILLENFASQRIRLSGAINNVSDDLKAKGSYYQKIF